MAKNRIILILLMLFVISISCKMKSYIDKESNKVNCKIATIDSISGVYVIRAISSEKYFKIVSKKSMTRSSNCKNIKVGKKYSFTLTSILMQEKFRTEVDGVEYEGEIIKKERDSIHDIYTALELDGLCYKK